MIVSLHVLEALFLFSRVLSDRILAITRFGRGPDPEAARVHKGHGHLIFPVKAGELF